MQEDVTQDSEDEGGGVVAGATFFMFGLVVPALFFEMARGADFVSFLAIFGAFAACVVFGEYYMTLTSGVAFGAGLVMTSLLSFDWWFAGLAVAATLVNMGRYAASNHQGLLDSEDALEPMDQHRLAES